MPEKKYSIIADPNGPGWYFAQGIYDDLKSRGDEFELNEVHIKRFDDGESKPKISGNVRKKDCFFIHDSNKPPAEWLSELALINQALRKSSAGEITNVLPYFKFARQDRKDESRVPISAKVVADIIELYADKALTLDIHNNSIDGFFKIRFDNLHSFPTVIKKLKNDYPEYLENAVVMATDTGGASRANAFAKRLGIKDIVLGHKSRGEDGKIKTYKIIGEVEGKNVFMIDDIAASGGTFVDAAQAARKNGARKIYGYCTHGLFTNGSEHVLSHFDKFFVGDTLKQKEAPNMEIISMIPLFAEAIYRISKGMSLSALFD